MQGNMWVESEVNNGSKFYFTITSQISPMSMEGTLAKLHPYSKRHVLFVDTLHDQTGVVQRIAELGLVPIVIHDVADVKDKEKTPAVDTVIVDGHEVVCILWHQVGLHLTCLYRPSVSGSMSTFVIYRSCC